MVSESAGKVDLYFTQKEGNEYSETEVFFQVFDIFYRDKYYKILEYLEQQNIVLPNYLLE